MFIRTSLTQACIKRECCKAQLCSWVTLACSGVHAMASAPQLENFHIYKQGTSRSNWDSLKSKFTLTFVCRTGRRRLRRWSRTALRRWWPRRSSRRRQRPARSRGGRRALSAKGASCCAPSARCWTAWRPPPAPCARPTPTPSTSSAQPPLHFLPCPVPQMTHGGGDLYSGIISIPVVSMPEIQPPYFLLVSCHRVSSFSMSTHGGHLAGHVRIAGVLLN